MSVFHGNNSDLFLNVVAPIPCLGLISIINLSVAQNELTVLFLLCSRRHSIVSWLSVEPLKAVNKVLIGNNLTIDKQNNYCQQKST